MFVSLTYKRGFDFEILKDVISEAIRQYFVDLAKTWSDEEQLYVRINQLETILLDIDGIADITETRFNGESHNVILTFDEIPILGEVNEIG